MYSLLLAIIYHLAFISLRLGCAPIYPSIIHATPANFGAENSQAVIGVQMAATYIGSTLMPPLFGAIAQITSLNVLPAVLLVLAVILLVASERLNRIGDEART